MVATFIEKTVSKSYVRLPGSGKNKEAGISFCDLSRGSSLAACITVPHHVSIPTSQNAKLTPSNQNISTTHKRQRTEDNTVGDNESNKRLRIDTTKEHGSRTSIENTATPVTYTAGPVIVSPQPISSNNCVPVTYRANNEPIREPQNPTKIFIISNPVEDVTKLRNENTQLRSENEVLQKQLSLFKQLIRNPQRLESVLQRLNERAC
ncbi:unnamed protein product [Meganyctiphanes norvegica]|uniref:Uncharacterized protein n=1 Tax=Meganyctiphanes norvegica TaxID=48144 RepID=A0AAV2Q4W1_MEGNR